MTNIDSSCIAVGDIESIVYLFFTCLRAAAIWINSPLRLRSALFTYSNAKSCWEDLASFLGKQPNSVALLQMATFILWHLWNNRNSFIFRKHYLDVNELLRVAMNHLDDFCTAMQMNSNTSFNYVQFLNVAVSWNPPSLDGESKL